MYDGTLKACTVFMLYSDLQHNKKSVSIILRIRNIRGQLKPETHEILAGGSTPQGGICANIIARSSLSLGTHPHIADLSL